VRNEQIEIEDALSQYFNIMTIINLLSSNFRGISYEIMAEWMAAVSS